MDSKPSVIISSSPFPNQYATDAEKKTQDYGLRVGKAIEGEWFKRVNAGSCRYYDQYLEFHKLRLYARGIQPTQMYKDLLSVDGDLSYMNLDWKPVPIIPKFVDIVVNGMADRLYSIKAESQDINSAEKKNMFQEMVEADMLAKDFLVQTKEQFGIDAFNVPQEELPENDEELALYMQLKYKPSIEIAEEVAINTLLDMNDYKDVIKTQVDKDLTEIGIGVVKHSFLAGAGLEIEYVDPASIIYSYTEKPDFSDIYYVGEVKQVHYTEIRKINPSVTDETLKDIKNSGSAWYNYYPIIRTFQDDVFDDEVVTLLYFNYKTEKRFVYKKKYLENGGERVIRRDETFNPEAGNEMFERVDVVKDVWYEGVLVLGTNIMLKWEMLENMVRPDAATQKALSNYVMFAPSMYKGQIQSLVKRMIPFADQIQLTHLKLQQVMARVVPDGVFIDADGISEVDLGTGAAYNPEDALKLYFQTGSVVGRSYTGDGEFNNARVPIQELVSNSGQSKMAALIGNYNYNLNMIRDVTGLNEARDGSTPDPNALVGVQKMAALNSNVATRHILQGGLMITKRLAECVSLRVNDILQYADFRDEFAMQIGKYNLAILEDIKDLYLHSFGIFIEVEPDQEEKQQLEANIQISLSRDQIDLEDAIDIRMIKNLKLANEMLKVKRKRKLEKQQQREDMQQQMQMQINMQSQEAAAQQKQMTAQTEAQAKIAIKQNEAQLEMQKMQFEVDKKKELMELEFQYNMQLKGIETDGLMKREKEREKAKDKRVDLQAERQSELINQRKNNLPPVKFESTEDSLDDFDLGSFEPR
jgi:hypothetical protein